jgi:hypothetical protein
MMNPGFMVIIALLLVGCTRHQETAPTSAQAPGTSESQPAAGNPAVITASPGLKPAAEPTAAALQELTHLLRRYSAANQRVPTALSEVVTEDYLASLPLPPAGKKYGFDPKRLEAVLVPQ